MKRWTWGAEHETTREAMESCIEDYLINELNARGLHTIVGPDGRKYNIKVVAELLEEFPGRFIPVADLER